MCRAYGFRDMGVFIDWASLFQQDANRRRTDAEQRAFKRALTDTMDLWYGHTRITAGKMHIPVLLVMLYLTHRVPRSQYCSRFYRTSYLKVSIVRAHMTPGVGQPSSDAAVSLVRRSRCRLPHGSL